MDDNTKQLLEQLAAKFGTTTEYLWGVLVKQAQIEVITNIIWAVVLFALLIPVIKYIKWIRKNWEKLNDNSNDIGHVIVASISSIIVVICFFIGVCCVESAIVCAINPEYWALSKILDSLKPAK